MEGRKCCICSSGETYVNNLGISCWFVDRDKNGDSTGKWRCSKCYRRIPDNIKNNRYGKTKCYKCRIEIGKTKRYKERNDKGIWTGRWLCKAHYNKIKNDELDNYKNIIKEMRRSRIGYIDKYEKQGRIIISQWIGAKTLGLKDLNIERNNFGESVDLSIHPIYGFIDVKYATLTYGEYRFNLGDEYKRDKCDNFLLLCMDECWNNVELVYIIRRSQINIQTITLYKDKSLEYGAYKVSVAPYNDIYHSVYIPELFNPFDLWADNYDIKR